MAAKTDIEIVLVSGRSGSGKTSVAFEMCEQLRRRACPHANIDADFLDEIWPKEDGAQMLLNNLAAIWSNYRRMRGCPRLLLSGTAVVTEADRIRETIVRASQPENVTVQVTGIILTATDDIAAGRLGKREIGSALERHVLSSNKWARALEELPSWAHRIATDGRGLSEIAAEALRCAGWPCDGDVEQSSNS